MDEATFINQDRHMSLSVCGYWATWGHVMINELSTLRARLISVLLWKINIISDNQLNTI